MKLGLALYRVALVLYPRRFRLAWGHDMVDVLARRIKRASRLGGRISALATLCRALGDLVWSALRTRLSGRSRTSYSMTPSPRLPRQQEQDRMLSRIIWNLRQALRAIWRQPALSALVVCTLALGTGGTIAFFGIADAALVRPLPYPEPDRLVLLSQVSDQFGRYGWAGPFVPELREQAQSYDELVGFSPSWTMTMTAPGEPQAIASAFISNGLFELFGARLIAGRTFNVDEYLPGAPPLVVVNESFWRRHLGQTLQLDGQTLTLDGTVFEIIGVVGDSLRIPIASSAFSSGSADIGVWLPIAQNAFLSVRARPIVRVVGRLANGISPGAAAAELQAINARFDAEYPDVGIAPETEIAGLAGEVSLGSRAIIAMLLGAAAFLLCIACANVANLLLARASSRTEEIAIRASLGATRLRIIEQLLAESALLAGMGGALGLVLAAWLMRAIPALGFLNLPDSAVVRFDLRVVAFAVVLSLATALLFGLAPAIRLSRRGAALIPGNGTRATDARASRARSVLVAAEVALAVVLLVGAGLLTRSFDRLSRVDPGFRADNILAAPLSLSRERWPTSDDRLNFHQQLQQNARALPGVEAVAAVNRVPLGGSNVFAAVELESGSSNGEQTVTMDRRVVTSDYFRTIEVPIHAGRDFDDGDLSDSEDPVAILNQAALGLLADPNPIGQRVRLQYSNGSGPWLRIVGVVGDVHHHGLDAAAAPEIYVPYQQAAVRGMTILMRTTGDPAAFTDAFKAAVWRLDDEIALDGIEPISDVVDASISDPRVRMLMMQSFAALALALAGLGISGVVSHTVARRARDYGIRVALGARKSEVLLLALRDGMIPGAVGAIVGVVAAAGLSRWVASMLFATSPTDPVTFVAVAAMLLALVALASWIPARRATRVDPVTILRDE